jgi:hypothetical protein
MSCCENMLITCFAFCLEMWNVIWEMRFRFVLCRNCLRRFILVIMLDHLIVSFSDRLASLLTSDACSFSIIEWRMSVLDLSSDVYDETSSLTRHLIKFDESISSNLTRATHQIWRKRLIKLDEKDVISSNFDESVISSNLRSSSHQTFEKKSTLSTFWWAISCNNAWYEKENLVLQKIAFVLRESRSLCKDAIMISDCSQSMKAERWYNSAFSYKEELQVTSKQLIDDCFRSDDSSS